LAVEQDHSCDLFAIPAGEDPNVLCARRMADEHKGTRNAPAIEQDVEVPGHGDTVLRGRPPIAGAALSRASIALRASPNPPQTRGEPYRYHVFLRACDRTDDERQCGDAPGSQASDDDWTDLLCGH
jgi:hypothetical protein